MLPIPGWRVAYGTVVLFFRNTPYQVRKKVYSSYESITLLPSNLQYKTRLSRHWNCWSLRCSWSIACRWYSNYIFILDLTPGFNGAGKDNCKKMRWETFKFANLVHLMLEVWQYSSDMNLYYTKCLKFAVCVLQVRAGSAAGRAGGGGGSVFGARGRPLAAPSCPPPTAGWTATPSRGHDSWVWDVP